VRLRQLDARLLCADGGLTRGQDEGLTVQDRFYFRQLLSGRDLPATTRSTDLAATEQASG